LHARKNDYDQEGKEKNSEHFVHQKDDEDINIGCPRDRKDPADELKHHKLYKVDHTQDGHAIEIQYPKTDTLPDPGIMEQEAGIKPATDNEQDIQQERG
jgi:hypothetical protein